VVNGEDVKSVMNVDAGTEVEKAKSEEVGSDDLSPTFVMKSGNPVFKDENEV
jgi:hypothetical protein